MQLRTNVIRLVAGAGLLWTVTCSWDPSGLRAPPLSDASLPDAHRADAAPDDAGVADGAVADAAPADAGAADASLPDANAPDAGATCGDNQCDDGAGETWQSCPADCNWLTLDAGTNHSCGIRRDGSLWCWGKNDRGQLGDGTVVPKNVPHRALLPSRALAVSVGEDFACAVVEGGTVSCWGKNDHGQLGDNSVVDRLSPAPVPGLSYIRLVAAGGTHACAVSQLGQVFCWGRNDKGQLGDATLVERHVPGPVSPATGLGPVARITAGEKHTCVIDNASAAWCWGDKGNGRLGDGSGLDQWTPARVSTSTGMLTATDISGGTSHTCAVDGSGAVWCWGNKGNGRLGDDTNSEQPLPAAVVTTTGLTASTRVSAGDAHTCALRTDQVLLCWGKNDQGQLGSGLAGDQPVPMPVDPSSGLVYATGISAGSSHTAAWQASGEGWGWGKGDDGQIGDGANLDRDPPAPMVGN